MFWNRFKYIYIVLFFIFILSGTLAYFWMLNPKPQTKPPMQAVQQPRIDKAFQITNETEVIFQEEYKVCKKYDLNCIPDIRDISHAERKQLNGLTIKEVKQIFNEENWQVIENINKNQIVITQLIEGLCPEHKKIWHLGINSSGDYIAIYYGPSQVKKEGGIYKVTEIPITQLSPADQEKLKNYGFEFYQEEELVAILDSFSEFLD